MSILIVNLLSIDNQKAYAVTISHTGEALKRTTEVEFLGPARFATTGLDRNFQVRWKWFCKGLWRISRLVRYTGVDRLSILIIRYLIGSALFFNRNSLKSNFIWTRDVRIALLASRLGISSLCEVHKSFSRRELLSLKRTTNFNNLVFAPISSNLKAELLKLDFIQRGELHLVELPMGVNQEFLKINPFRVLLQSYPLIRIGYFGSMSTMGVSSGIDLFIRLLSQVDNYNFHLLLVGIGKEGKYNIDELTNEIDLSRLEIEIVERVEHHLVPNLMQQCDILVVPYEEGTFNNSRFPIKTVEYASSRIPILCSDTTSHRSILGERCAWFFSYEKLESLTNAIASIIRNSDLRDEKIENAYEWAKELSYEKRAERIYEALAQLRVYD